MIAGPLFVGADLDFTKIFTDGDNTTFVGYYGEVGVKF
jgi:hypothetical protein